MYMYIHVESTIYAPGIVVVVAVLGVALEAVEEEVEGGEVEVVRAVGLLSPGHTMPPDPAMAWDAWLTTALDDPSIGTHISE